MFDSFPVAPGHALVLPRRHCATIWDLDAADHVIPRYMGDTPNPLGGVRHVIPLNRASSPA